MLGIGWSLSERKSYVRFVVNAKARKASDGVPLLEFFQTYHTLAFIFAQNIL